MDRTEPFYIELHPNITSGNSYYYEIRLFAAMGKGWVFDSVEYSLDKANWITVDTSGDWIRKTIIRLDNPTDGNRVWLRAKPSDGSWGTSSISYCCSISIKSSTDQKVNVGGNIMSLIYGGDFTGNEVDFPSGSEYNFRKLLSPDIDSGIIEDASQLILPATTLTNGCYRGMFQYCTSLTSAPIITQATIQSGYPYDYMFQGCSSLESITIENTNIRNNDDILYKMSPKTIVYKKEGVTTPRNPNNLTVVTLKNTPFNVANAKQWVINNKEVKQVVDSQNRIIWKKSSPTPSYSTPFYVEDMSGSENTLSINKISGYAPTLTIEMSRDGVNWSTLGTTSTTAISTSIPAYGRVYLRCNASSWCANIGEANCIYCPQSYRVGGNIMSLLYGSNFVGNEVIFPSGSDSNFSHLFYNSSISDASTLILPATTLTELCYGAMFASCSSLTTAPALPEATLANYCYYSMFYGCTSLTTAPTLPATTLADFCYQYMFYGCTSLTTAPTLPALTLVSECYGAMFDGCTVLNNITCLATNISVSGCLDGWVNDVSQTGTFTKKAGVTWPTGTSGIPNGWTVVEE